MSSDSLAVFRKNLGDHLGELAEQHYKHDLQDSDRDRLKRAAGQLSTQATIGSLVGLGLGLFLAFRLRTNRAAMFNAFKASEKPTHVKFANGREEAIPNLTPLLKPTTLGDIATYTFLAGAGVFFGGELGLLIGSASAARTVSKDADSRQRIEAAFRKFRAEVLKEQAVEFEKGTAAIGFGSL